jgi:hypothetical protein
MSLSAFILEPDLQTGLERFLADRLDRCDHRLTQIKEQIAIAPFAVGQQGQVIDLFNHPRQGGYRLFKQGCVSFTRL